MKKKGSLSLFEVLVMALILGFAGRGIFPHLTEESMESKVSGLIEGLQRMRASLDLYRVYHENSLPPVDSLTSFETAVTTGTGRYTPCLKAIPTNPFNNSDTVRFDGEPAGTNEAGWKFDTATGVFQPDNGDGYADL